MKKIHNIIFLSVCCLVLSSPAFAKNEKTDICHLDQETGETHVINVSVNSVEAHLTHGDNLVTDEVCDDEIDNNCDGQVDEDCGPGLCEGVICPQDDLACFENVCNPGTGECVSEALGDGETCIDSNLTNSFIPNPSFEDHSGCPTSFSQLYHADTWIQATDATSDYFINSPTCSDTWFLNGTGGIAPLMQHAPDGDGFVGAIMIDASYIEYIGACLDEPLAAGTEYTLQMQVAAAGPGPGFSYGGDSMAEIALLCITDCSQLPISGYDDKADDFEVIGTANVNLVGGDPWQTVTLNALPTVDCPAVIFGPTVSTTVEAGFSGAYIMFDDLVLNESSSFEGVCEAGECVPVE